MEHCAVSRVLLSRSIDHSRFMRDWQVTSQSRNFLILWNPKDYYRSQQPVTCSSSVPDEPSQRHNSIFLEYPFHIRPLKSRFFRRPLFSEVSPTKIMYAFALPLLLTGLLIPWSRVLLEKLTGFQLVKKFPAFYGTRRFITAFTNARHLSLSRASSIHSIPPTSYFLRSILIL